MSAQQAVPLGEGQARYLFSVMRLGAGDGVRLFNGRDGEWRASVAETGKRRGIVVCDAQSRAQWGPPDLWLVFAPVKKEQTRFIVEKAVEMGAARLCPVLTDYTNSERVRRDRMQAHATEAAEQCGALVVPDVAEPQRFDRFLDGWNRDRRLLYCDETMAGASNGHPPERGGPWGVLIGPEGGFSPAERGRLGGAEFDGVIHAQRLGPRILRAETAVVAALTLWQTRLGDWQ